MSIAGVMMVMMIVLVIVIAMMIMMMLVVVLRMMMKMMWLMASTKGLYIVFPQAEKKNTGSLVSTHIWTHSLRTCRAQLFSNALPSYITGFLSEAYAFCITAYLVAP